MAEPINISLIVDAICNPIHEKQKSCIWLKYPIVKFNSNHRIERGNCISEGDFVRLIGTGIKDSKLFSDVSHRVLSVEGDTKRILAEDVQSGRNSFIQLTD